MTDHHKGYIVVLDQSIREDEAKATINALRMVKGVIGVTPIVEDVGSMVGEMRVRNTVRASLFQWIRENL